VDGCCEAADGETGWAPFAGAPPDGPADPAEPPPGDDGPGAAAWPPGTADDPAAVAGAPGVVACAVVGVAAGGTTGAAVGVAVAVAVALAVTDGPDPAWGRLPGPGPPVAGFPQATTPPTTTIAITESAHRRVEMPRLRTDPARPTVQL
jgi:hypothetical protein